MREELQIKRKEAMRKVEKPEIIDLIDENNSEEMNRESEYERFDGSKRVKRDLGDERQ